VLASIGLGAWLLLYVWRPSRDSFASVMRWYFLGLIGALFLSGAAVWSLRRAHLGQYANLYAVGFVILGLGTAVGAFTKARWYWMVASNWPLWASVSERTRQVGLTIAGLAIAFFGVLLGARSSRAYNICQQHYRTATTWAESTLVAREVPDSSLRPPRGRFELNKPVPFKCADLD